MSRRSLFSAAALIFIGMQSAAPQDKPGQNAGPVWSQVPPNKPLARPKTKPAPAPKRDLSGIWDALASGGIQAKGAHEVPALIAGHPQDEIGGQPDERRIEHQIPYTEAGLAALKLNKPSVGVRSVGPGESNDPVNGCEPPGFPRLELYDFREVEITQTKNQVLMLYELNANYRVIWTDGRPLPKDADPRWFGYSVGKWVDDYTFVVQTVGLNEKTWLDHAGRPHSADLMVEERYRRVDSDTIELTMTITDAKYYSKPWLALDKFVLHRLPDDYDWLEYVCAPSDILDYNAIVGDPVSRSNK